ncbi:MAG: DUF5110 domain-containing protein, partial [Sphingobacteriales bacterium]
YEMYDDDGVTNKTLEKNQYELLQMNGQNLNGKIKMEIKSNGGKFNGRPSKRTLKIYVADMSSKPSSVTFNNMSMTVSVDGADGGMSEWKPGKAIYFPGRKMVALLLEFTDKPLSIELLK